MMLHTGAAHASPLFVSMHYELLMSMQLIRHAHNMNQRKYLIAILILAAIGLTASSYLTWLHQQIFSGQLNDFSFCGISRTISCEAVSASPYSEWFGVPVAWYGVLAYLLWLSLSAIGLVKQEKHAATALGLILITATSGFLIDLYLAYTMAIKIKSLCLLCLLTYVLNLIIVILAFRAGDKPVLASLRESITAAVPFTGRGGYAFPALLMVVVGIGMAGGYELRKTVEHELASFDEAGFMRYRAKAPRYSVDTASDPYLGAEDAKLTIVEFSDFQCPHCRKAHIMVQTILPPYSDRVRLVFKNLPLGRDCNPMMGNRDLHPAACKLARLGEAAAEQDGFWPLHDVIFEQQSSLADKSVSKDDMLNLGRQAGLDMPRLEKAIDGDGSSQAVRDDIDEAMRLRIKGTPTYFFNGLLIRGIRSPIILQRMIEIELEATNKE